ncbi:hypothetical protein IFM89_029004 [Coptis chinensis]|uniref:Uncharacterized protein n=1 Tax=Coptis chinensis TaxID=261450 RepID=A0A835IIB2_9MAGN|nr:hypothetical protein IFM89_029004 [Coptis chinensis]
MVKKLFAGGARLPIWLCWLFRQILGFSVPLLRFQVANDPANPPSRTDIFVVTHTRKNGTFVSGDQWYHILYKHVSCKAWGPGRVVAIGRMLGDREDIPENAYRIIVDEILEFNVELFGAKGQTFCDIDVGSTIT